MHPSVMAWFEGGALTRTEVAGKSVLEVGAYDVNGSVRPLIETFGPASYLGVDQTPGPRVDEVCDAAKLEERFGRDAFDIVITCEMLEHAQDWRACLRNMVQVLRPGGVLVLTTRSPGFGYHPFPDDHWRYTIPTMSRILVALGLGSHEIRPDPDLASPGVFAKARKSEPWVWDPDGLAAINVVPAPGKEGVDMADQKDPVEQVPYQQAAQIRQLLAERANAATYGQTTRVDAVDKQLEALGYTGHKQAAKTAAEPEKAPPQGRSTRPRQTTATTE